MRFPRSTLLVVSACVALAFLPATATAGPPDAPGRSSSAPRSERAEATLAAVRAAFAGDPAATQRRQVADGREVTLLLAQLRRQLDDLGPRDRQVASAFLARPTDGNDPYVGYSRRARATNDCRVAPTRGSKVCIHWARATSHAPSTADRDRDRLPNQVEKTRDVANAVWRRIVTRGGYRRPLADDGGPNRKLDIYLADIGAEGLYGYCVTEDRVSGRAYTGYCVVDDDYSPREFVANTPTDNLKVTVAHEFFHAVQFAYDAAEEDWFMEGSAAWIEDEIYDGVDDNHIYLEDSPLAKPLQPLDAAAFRRLQVYGSWIFWRFLTERYDAEGSTGLPLLMRRMWQDADHHDVTSPRLQAKNALRRELARHDATLPESYADFSAANRRPSAFGVYEEGGAYERYVAPPVATHRLTTADPVVSRSRSLDHLTSATIQVQPAADLGRGRTLRLQVGKGGLGPEAAVRVAVVTVDGTVQHVPATDDGGGGWTVSIPGFDAATTRHVELTLVNGATTTNDALMSYTASAAVGSR